MTKRLFPVVHPMNIQNLQAEILRCGTALTQQGVIRMAEQLGWAVDHWQASDAILTRPGHVAVCIPWNMTAADLRHSLKVLLHARLQEGRSLTHLTPVSPLAQRFITQTQGQHPETQDARILATTQPQPCEGTPASSPVQPVSPPGTPPATTPIATVRLTPSTPHNVAATSPQERVHAPDQAPTFSPQQHVSPQHVSPQDDRAAHPADQNPGDPEFGSELLDSELLDSELLDAFVATLALIVEQSQITFLEVAGEQFQHLQQQFERYELEQIQVLDDTLDELVRQHQGKQTWPGRSPQSPGIHRSADILPQVGYPSPTPTDVTEWEPQHPASNPTPAASIPAATWAEQVAVLQQQLRECQGKLAQTERTLGRTQARLRAARSAISQTSLRQDQGLGDRWPWGGHLHPPLIGVGQTQAWIRPLVWATGMVIVLAATAWVTMVGRSQQTERSSLPAPRSLPVLLGRLPHLDLGMPRE